jgi:hypothetical protein
MFRGRIFAIALSLLLLVVGTVGCGGGGSSDSSTGSISEGTNKEVGDKSAKSESPSAKEASEARAYYMESGSESSDTEREAATAVLAENLEARADGDWATQCKSLSTEAITKLEEPAKIQERKRGCVVNLKILAEPLSSTKKVRADQLSGSITALRVKGSNAFAIFEDTEGKGYVMPMKKENGQWKVGALLTTELP